jgi:hypothetical protein
MKPTFRYFVVLILLALVFACTAAAQAPVITSTSPLPAATVGISYSFQFEADEGYFEGSSQWFLDDPFSSPAPPGLTLSSNGLLEGTPSTAGQFTFDVSVSGYTEEIETKTFVLDVQEGLALLTQSTLPAGSAGKPYQVTLAATGGMKPYIWTLLTGAFPVGYSLNTRTGEIKGVTP